MSATFVVKIPTRPYLKAYMEGLYGSPLTFSSDNYFSLVVLALLSQKIRPDRSAIQIQHRVDTFIDCIELRFPKHWRPVNGRKRFTPKPVNVLAINKLLEERFEEELFLYCETKTSTGKRLRKDAIYEFAAKHKIEIDEHITYDNLKQMEFRFRKKKEADEQKEREAA